VAEMLGWKIFGTIMYFTLGRDGKFVITPTLRTDRVMGVILQRLHWAAPAKTANLAEPLRSTILRSTST
jgi:hypothetical protein